MNWLFTGFGPFGDVSYNPSWDAAQAAAEVVDASAELLPVTFDAARALAERPCDRELVVHFGVAKQRDDVCLERYAHNWRTELGEVRPQRLQPDGPVALECPAALDELAATLDGAADLHWRVSHDAGTFVCNATLYFAIAANHPAIFVHIPPTDALTARAIGQALATVLAAC